MRAPGRRRVLLGAAGLVPGLALGTRSARADDDEVDVAILGGGLAGLTAGRALVAGRKKVLVLEARDRIGGRALADTSLGFAVDLGAAWLAPDPTAKELGAKLLPGPEVGAIVLSGKPLTAEQTADYAKTADKMTALAKEIAAKFPGADPAQVIHPVTPADQLAFFRLTNKPPFAIAQPLDGGIGAAVAHLGAKVPVRFGTRVLRINWTGWRRIEVVTISRTVQARAVVVALPASVLGGGHIGFAPPLSAAKHEALAASPMASCLRIAVSFQPGQPKAPANTWVTGLAKAACRSTPSCGRGMRPRDPGARSLCRAPDRRAGRQRDDGLCAHDPGRDLRQRRARGVQGFGGVALGSR